MIYLIHGENQVDSRKFLNNFKNSYQDIQTYQSKSLKQRELEQQVREFSRSFFGEKAAIFVENFDGKWDEEFSHQKSAIDLILWSSKKIEKVPTGVKEFHFKKYKNINTFKLADEILARDETRSLEILNELILQKEPPEKIVGALARGLALLYSYKRNEIKKGAVADFLYKKLSEQSLNWTSAQIKNALIELLKVDLGIKSGQKPATALSALIFKTL